VTIPYAVTGVIEGGWGYVVAAYLVTWVTLGGYALSLFLRSGIGGSK
jgi:CcmD family protein